MTIMPLTVRYPRRRVLRAVMHTIAQAAFPLISRLEVTGRENLPAGGPLIVVGNHFGFLDPAMLVALAPWPIEFLGGFRQPNSPQQVGFIPKLWGFLPVYRGTGSRDSLRAAETVLAQGGVLGIYPEGGSWAQVLRPARAGTAYLAARSGARLLPIGYDGLIDVFPTMRRGHRAKVTIHIGEPFGPYQATGHGRERRRQLDEIGHDIMRHIAALIPDHRRGCYADDPATRAAAQGTEVFPWDDEPES